MAFARPPTWSEKGCGKGGGFPEHWLDLIMLYMSSATPLMSIFLPNFALSHQDSYKSGRTPFRPPFPGTRISKNIHTCLSLGSNGLSIELLHTFLAWNSYPHMKISWFQLIMADFDDRSWQKIAIFCHLFQSQAMRCKIRTRWAMRIIFYSSDTPRVIFLPRDHLKKGGRKGVRSLSFKWLSSIKNWWKKTYCNDLWETFKT